MFWLDWPLSYYNCKIPFSNSRQEPLTNKGLLLARPGNYTAHRRPHCEVVCGREREKMSSRESTPRVLLLLESAVGA